MGLGIIVYTKLEPAPGVRHTDDGEFIRAEGGEIVTLEWDDYVHLKEHPHFFDRQDGLAGVYRHGGFWRFHADSYTCYGRWRDNLARMAGYPLAAQSDGRRTHQAGAWNAAGGPFWELIYMSDCDGFIGPKTAAKLAQDFDEWEQRAADALSDGFGKYKTWQKAMHDAADNNGVVCFC